MVFPLFQPVPDDLPYLRDPSRGQIEFLLTIVIVKSIFHLTYLSEK